MPEFLMIIADDEKERDALPREEFQAAYAKVGAWWEAHERAGRLAPGAGRRLQPTCTARTVRVGNGRRAAVTDGPFAETKESLGGFGILTVADMDAAIEVVKSCPGLPVTIEVRPVLTD